MLWFVKALGLDVRAIQGYLQITRQQKLPWNEMLKDLDIGAVVAHSARMPAWHLDNINRLQAEPTPITP